MFDLIGKAKAAAFDWGNFPGFKPVTATSDPAGQLKNTIGNIISWVLFLAAAVAVVYLIYGGFEYITAGGDAEKATKGRTAIVNAIIGLVIIALAYVIVAFVIRAVTGAAAG